MRPYRLIVLLLTALALTACARQPSRQQVVYRTAPIDTLMYGGAPMQSRMVARVQQAVPVVQEVFEDGAYTLDAGDKLRIVVFGQDTLSNTYTVDAAGVVTMPLIGGVNARGMTTAALSGAIAARLRASFIRDPSVAVEVETYRPFFVLGEVTFPGQYPYVPNMTVEKAIAIAGGFTPRATKDRFTVTRRQEGVPFKVVLRLQDRLRPGDTITVGERWF